ncbi:MAG TPA: pyrimidine 5'-nucleotidase [Caulobacteraceae bacterium]|nr:pyrimidine 5'-nucleotidase [Caulobacteraceae bacterium]
MSVETLLAADLYHVDTWVFDLDNTLYPLDSGLAEQVSARITEFVQRLTGLPADEARALQKRYLAEHGLTLRGLMTHHGVDPDDYHGFLGDISLECLSHDPDLQQALRRLPGRRLIFTNASAGHAARVLARLHLSDLFDEVFHIASADFLPKPAREAFAAIISAHAIDPASAAFFDDAECNLEPAAAMGMTTVLVGPAAQSSTALFVDYRAPRLAPFLAVARLKANS